MILLFHHKYPLKQIFKFINLFNKNDKVAFFLEFHKTEEILAERVLKIGPNGFLQVIVKWLARYLTFRFFPIFKTRSDEFFYRVPSLWVELLRGD